jgi:hypothetical protein
MLGEKKQNGKIDWGDMVGYGMKSQVLAWLVRGTLDRGAALGTPRGYEKQVVL